MLSKIIFHRTVRSPGLFHKGLNNFYHNVTLLVYYLQLSTADHSMGLIYTHHSDLIFPFTKQSYILKTLKKQAFENIVQKGENAGCQHFLLFPQRFLTFHFIWVTIHLFLSIIYAFNPLQHNTAF